MAINDTVPEITYLITAASTGPFPIPFEFSENEDLRVYLFTTGTDPEDGDILVLDDDYTVTGEGEDAGGTLTLRSAATSKSLKIERSTVLDRATDVPSSGPFSIPGLNREFDRQLAIDQEAQRDRDRAIRARQSLSELPADRSAGGVVGFAAGAPNTPIMFGVAGSPTDIVQVQVTTLAALQATSAAVLGNAVLLLGRDAVGDGGGGSFYWSSIDNSANVTNDPRKGLFIPPATDLTGASGAWVRVFPAGYLNLQWFGTDAEADAGDLITDAQITGAALEHRTLFIPDGDWNLATPIVPKTDITILGSPKARFLQKDYAGVANPSGTSLKRFKFIGGTFVYSHAVPSNMHRALDLGSHQYCEIDLTFDDYAQTSGGTLLTAQILLYIKTTNSGAQTNTVANSWKLRSDSECGIGVWYQGLEGENILGVRTPYYTEADGTGGVLDVVTNFDATWPADLLVVRWRADTGLLVRLAFSTGYTLTAGGSGVLGPATVRPVTNVPVGDKLMIWPSRAISPLNPITNNDLYIWVRDCARATVYAVRYMDSDRITGHSRLSRDGAAHIWTNPVGLFNAELDYVNLMHPVMGHSAPDPTTVHVLRFGPGTTRTMGAVQMDSLWGTTAAPEAVEINDRSDFALTGTVTTNGVSSNVAGDGTCLFTREIPSLGASTLRLKFNDNGDEFAVVSVNGLNSLTVDGIPAARAGVGVRLQDPTSGVTYANLTCSHNGLGGNGPPLVVNRKAGHMAKGQAAIANPNTSVVVSYPHPLSRTPVAGEIHITPASNIDPGVSWWLDAIGATSFTIRMSGASAGTELFDWRIQLEDFT